jgi:hypothetical protein
VYLFVKGESYSPSMEQQFMPVACSFSSRAFSRCLDKARDSLVTFDRCANADLDILQLELLLMRETPMTLIIPTWNPFSHGTW